MNNIEVKTQEEHELNLTKLIIYTLISVLVLTAVFVFIGIEYKEAIESKGKELVESHGVLALWGSFYITAVAFIPLPDHALSVFAWMGGMNFWVDIGISTLGSVTGGMTAYYLGKLLKQTALYARLMKRYKAKTEYLIRTYGGKGLAITCLTPLPYSPVCWMCGALDFSLSRFFWILFICRLIKVTYVLWFVKLGLLTF